LRLKRLSANLPGRSRLLLDATAFSGLESSEAAGKVAFETNDLRQFMTWKWPALKPQTQTYWAGSRGQFKLQSDFSVSNQGLTLSRSEFELDRQRGTADITLQSQGSPGIDARIKITSLDADSFLRRSTADGQTFKFSEMAGILGVLLHNSGTSLVLDAGAFILNGVRASAVRFDGETGPKGLTLRTLDVSLLGDARVVGRGDMSVAEGLPQGSFEGSVTAKDPVPLLQLLGILKPANLAQLQRGLGQTDAAARLVFGQTTDGPVANVTANGKSGALAFESTLTLSDFVSGDGMTYKGIAGVTTSDDSIMLAMMGVDAVGAEQRPGKLQVVFDGNGEAGINLSIKSSLLSADGEFEGLYRQATDDVPQLEGALKISATDTAQFVKALGVPLTEQPSGPFSVATLIKPQLDALRFEQVEGVIAGEAFSGEMDWKNDGSISSDFTVQSLTAQQLLAGVFLPWNGLQASLDSSFDGAPPFGVKGEFWLRPKQFQLLEGMPLSETVIGIVIEGRERQVTLAARDQQGNTVSAEAAMLPSSGQYTIEMTGDAPFELSQLLKFADNSSHLDGAVRISAKASGNGMSPAALLSDLGGEGRLKLIGVEINRFSPEQFASGIKQANSSDQLRAGISALQSAADYSLTDSDIPIKISLGRLSVEQFTRDTGASTQTFDISVDFQDRSLSALSSVTVKELVDVPPAKLWFEGAFTSLRARAARAAANHRAGGSSAQTRR
jgi:hypothetical protein